MRNSMGTVVTPLEMKAFIIETLALEDLAPEGLDDDELLFAGGLGLDSIDALELGIALRQRFKVRNAGLQDDFRTVRSLVAFVSRNAG